MRAVLVVDDDAAVARLVAAVLRRDGLHVDLAADGPEALDRLQAGRYDAVLTDMTMPAMSGHELVREAQRRGHRLPFLVLTAFLDPATEQALRDDPAVTGILRKPFDIARLLHEVRALLERADAAQPAPRPAPPTLALAPLWLVRPPHVFRPAVRAGASAGAAAADGGAALELGAAAC